jgi:hypothetical protein
MYVLYKVITSLRSEHGLIFSLPVMISDNEPVLTKYISVPRELSQLNCNAFLAGVVEAILDSAQFVSVGRMVI